MNATTQAVEAPAKRTPVPMNGVNTPVLLATIFDVVAGQPQLAKEIHRSGRNLGVLRGMGVRLIERVLDIDGTTLALCDDLPRTTAALQATLERLLARIDPVADAHRAPLKSRPVPLASFASSPVALDVAAEGICTVLRATGFRLSYPWLNVPVLDDAGHIIHAGVASAPGLYMLGLRFPRRRSSNFLGGGGADAAALSAVAERSRATSMRDVEMFSALTGKPICTFATFLRNGKGEVCLTGTAVTYTVPLR